MENTAALFRHLGAEFLHSPELISAKYRKIKAFIFDWDGVFNDGTKYSTEGSLFSEADSMGVNMLRFDRWQALKQLPFTFIITGANNLKACTFAKREHFHGVFLNYIHKEEALTQIFSHFKILPEETAFFFDDILDLGVAKKCGLSLCVRRAAAPLFSAYLRTQKMTHYISGSTGGAQAVREISEMLMGINGTYQTTIEKRIAFRGDYAAYLKTRAAINTQIQDYRNS